MFGIVIIILVIFSAYSASSASSSASRAALAATCFLTSSASSLLPCAIKAPICLESVFLPARRLSASLLAARLCLSSSMTSSTSGSFLSWNLLRIFWRTTSGFSLKNLISIMTVSPLCPISYFFFLHCFAIHFAPIPTPVNAAAVPITPSVILKFVCQRSVNKL